MQKALWYMRIMTYALTIVLLPPTLLCNENKPSDVIFLNASQLIHAIKTANHSVISHNRIDAQLLNKVYRNQTPLMIAIDALGSLMVRTEKNHKDTASGEYKNIVAPLLFTLATASASTYIYVNQEKKKKIYKFGSLEEIMENPIAIPGVMLFGGLIWLLPDVYHNVKTAYNTLVTGDQLHTNAIKNRYNVVTRLLNHPDVDLVLANDNGTIALDLVHKWQEVVTDKQYKKMLFDLEQKILEKMYAPLPKVIE